MTPGAEPFVLAAALQQGTTGSLIAITATGRQAEELSNAIADLGFRYSGLSFVGNAAARTVGADRRHRGRAHGRDQRRRGRHPAAGAGDAGQALMQPFAASSPTNGPSSWLLATTLVSTTWSRLWPEPATSG